MFEKIRNFQKGKSELELFLLRAGVIYVFWLILKLLLNNVSFLIPLKDSINQGFSYFLLHLSHKILLLFGFEPTIHNNHLFIEGSRGVSLVKGCLAWFLMSLYGGFIIVYPGNRKSKYYTILIGLGIIIVLNALRISGMVLISFYAPEKMHLYHKYIFKTILHLSVFIMWLVWVSKYGKK